MLDSITKLMPIVTIAGGTAASSPNVKAQLEKIFDTTKIVAAQSEVNALGQMVYLEMINETPVKPTEFAEYAKKNMRTRGAVKRDTSLDPWETPYGLAYDEKNHKLYVISAGPDKKYNTGDDVFTSYTY